MYTFYKYLDKRYAENLVQKGEILIRPLNEFKDLGKFTRKISDKKEGIVRFHPNGKVFDTADPTHNRSFATLVSQKIQAGRVIIDASEHVEFFTQNCFIYSVSQILDKDLLGEFKYDSCVKISPFEEFYRTLTYNMEKSGLKIIQTEVNECWYLNKDFDLSQELPGPPAFIKEKHFENQKEVRCAWIIEDVEEKPLIFTYPEITKFCSLIKQ
jgi:hypothetical protein